MKAKKLLTVAFLATLTLFLPLSPSQAKVRWLQTTHDFGAFKEDDGKVTCEFSFVNTGDEPVTVRAARASCGCTTPSFTKTPIEPGDTGLVKVAFNPTGRPGRFSKTVTMDIAGAGAGPRQTLVIKGVVIGSANTLRSRYPVEAGSMKLRTTAVPFGTVLKGKAKSAFVEVYNASASPIVPRWSNLPSYLRVASSADTVPAGEQVVYSLVLTPTETALYGILTDSLTLSSGPDNVKIDITAILEEDFSRLTPGQRMKAPVIKIDRDRVDFGEFPADAAPITRSFTIENTGKGDLFLRRVYTIDPGVTVGTETDKIKKGKSAQVRVTVYPDQLPSPLLNARIQIIANDPENPITIVRAVGLPQ